MKEILSIKFTKILRDSGFHKTIQKKNGYGRTISLNVFGNVDKEINKLIEASIQVLRPQKTTIGGKG